MIDVDIATLSDSELRDALIDARREIDQRECWAARLSAAADTRGIAEIEGATSTAAWIQHLTGQRVRDAKQAIRAGRACTELPLLADAWSAGEVATSAAHQIVNGRKQQFADEYGAIEGALVRFASKREYPELELLIRRYRAHCEAYDERDPNEPHGVSLSETTDAWSLSGTLDPYSGSVVAAALAAATPPPVADDTRTARCRRADALAHICEHYLASAVSTVEVGRPAQINVIHDAGGATVHHHVIDPTTTARLFCDAAIGGIEVDGDGVPIKLGRTRRVPTPGLRRAVLVRDRHCRFPGCDRPPKWCEVHHVIPWGHDGPTDLDNLVLLCSHHHHVVHKPGWLTTFDGKTFTATRVETSRASAA